MDDDVLLRAVRAELAQMRGELAGQARAMVLLTGENEALRGQVTRLVEENLELRRRLASNSGNSHRPPSSDGYAKPAPRSRRQPSDRPSGGQPGHPGMTLRQVQFPDAVVVHTPPVCAGCGGLLAKAPVTSTEARQVFDLPPIALHVVEHRLQHRRCDCGAVTMADPPGGVGAPTQYGPGVRALACYLLAAQHLPLARTAELLAQVVGAPVSQGTLAGWYADAADRLDPFLDVVTAGLASAPVLGADETGARVAGKLAWIHVARTDTLTRYTVSDRRGVVAMHEAGILPNLAADSVLVHDFWGPYWTFPVIHAVCGAHLGRELVAAAELPGQADWADGLDRLLQEINVTTITARSVGADMLAPDLLAGYRRRYQQHIEAGWAANPDQQPDGPPGGRRHRRPKHVNLLHRLDSHRDEVLRYATDLRVPMTNNGSERDVRPLKIRLKIAGCLRSMPGADAFCRLRSYLSTAGKQQQSSLTVLRMLQDGNPWIPAIS